MYNKQFYENHREERMEQAREYKAKNIVEIRKTQNLLYQVKRRAQLADPNYVPKKRGGYHPRKVHGIHENEK